LAPPVSEREATEAEWWSPVVGRRERAVRWAARLRELSRGTRFGPGTVLKSPCSLLLFLFIFFSLSHLHLNSNLAANFVLGFEYII
jgi:hypothetical protein